MHHPAEYFRNNFANTLNLLDAMRETEASHIVFSSTCATYGDPETIPISENHPQMPMNPYGESKLMAERLLKWYQSAYGLSWITLRYFNAAGTDPEGEIGASHNPETRLIPLAIAAAYGDLPELEVFGTDYETPDGTAIRDFIHVTDLAKAHVMALELLAVGCDSKALNLGTGFGHSVREVIAVVETTTHRKVPAKDCPRRAGDPAILVADASRASTELGWLPQLSALNTIVETADRWYLRLRQAGPLSELKATKNIIAGADL
jgi:UDP-glucose-4-epimerase GalE